MFSKVMAEVAGTSDNCSVYFRDQAQANATFAHFLLPNEKPYILLKSHKAEYIFTNMAYIFSFGEAAAGKKRNVYRFDYVRHPLSNVSFETAGMSVTDQDCEIKFCIANSEVSIDVKKAELELAVLVYRVLVQLSQEQLRNAQRMDFSKAFLTQANLHLNEEIKPASHMSLVDQIITTFNPTSYHEVMELATPR